MAADDWTQEYHLTPNGWVKGTHKFFKKGEVIQRPPDARRDVGKALLSEVDVVARGNQRPDALA